ncbi:MAG: lipase family protein [Aquisalinus sp.]|nr:lipase family protein [Aquisalinus sp.]
MKILKPVLLVTLLIVAGVTGFNLISGGSTHPPASPRGDVTLSDFYTPPTELPDTPGVLVKQGNLKEASHLANAVENLAILYSSTEGITGEEINVVSGALYLPEGTPPESGWPLLIWSHGTVGIGDICAPSYAGRSERDRTYLNPWLEAGYAIAASDYQGLGMPGTHPYMDARTMAYNNLDLIRAIQSSDFPVSKQVVIAGQSQGASGAIATAGYLEDYASEIDLRGIMATGIPYLSRKVILDLIQNSDPDAVNASLALSLYMLTLTEMIDPKFNLDRVVSDVARPIVDDIGETCVFDFISKTQEAGLSSRTTFTRRTEFALLKAFDRMRYPVTDYDIPVFTGSGTDDQITPYSMQQAFIEDACKAKATLVINTYDGANHNQGLLQSGDSARSFARAVMAGKAVESTCPAP